MTTTAPACPEHGATLRYEDQNGKKLYRCELGFARPNGTYDAMTHREFWAIGESVKEVVPHTSPWSVV